MLTQVEVFTPRVVTSPLPSDPLGSEATDPIQIRNIDGLGPVDATVNTTPYGSQDGAAYGGSQTGTRNIVLTLGSNPNWVDQTMESLRQILYAYFMPKNQVKLRFTSTHMATVEIVGYVESFTPSIFSVDPEIQVSIICPKSEFIAVAATVVTGVTVALASGTTQDVEYQGTLPTGFVLDVTKGSAGADMTAGELRIINSDPDEELFIVTADVTAATSFELSTEAGNKYVNKITVSSGTEASILGAQAAGSAWVTLDEGTNNFGVESTQTGQSWSLEYYAKYGGI